MIVHAALLASLAMPVSLAAQIRASELASMSQVIDGTKITVEYSRPRSRGRDPIFGKIVHWDEVWTPGANAATTLEVSKNVRVNGKPVAKGKYSVWMVVRKSGNWTVVLDPNARLFHTQRPDSTAAQIRFPVKVEAAPFTDVLTWHVPELRSSGGTLVMQWERVRVPLRIDVDPSLVMTFPASEAPAYVGEYTFIQQDSTGKPGKVSLFTISHENGMLKGRWTPDHPWMKKFALIRIDSDSFAPGIYDEKGELYEVLKPDIVMEVKRTNGRATSLVLRDMEDNVWGRGTLKR